jgi:hypothetical protein
VGTRIAIADISLRKQVFSFVKLPARSMTYLLRRFSLKFYHGTKSYQAMKMVGQRKDFRVLPLAQHWKQWQWCDWRLPTDHLLITTDNWVTFGYNHTIWRMPYSGMWRRVDLMLTDVSEERIGFSFSVETSTNEEAAWTGGCRPV